MFETLVWITAALCAFGIIRLYTQFQDAFHPALIILPMYTFIYVIMPLHQIHSGDLFVFVREEQLIWVQSIVLAGLICLIVGLDRGSNSPIAPPTRIVVGYRSEVLHKGAYVLGGIGLAAWAYTVHAGGGFANVYGHAKGEGWSELGFIRDASYLLIVALLLLLSPQGFRPRSRLWQIAVFAFSAPNVIQGLLGARRGPTFLIIVTLVMSWYFARSKRPSLVLVLGGGAALGLLLLLIVTNRDRLYLGSGLGTDKEVKTDTSSVLDASESNEYVFGAGCMIAARAENRYFWGKRYLAQVLVRPIPHQIWPHKYEDFGVPELLQNAGVAGPGLADVMGWSEVPGAAAAMVSDLWVEFAWLAIPVMGVIGYVYGLIWRRAICIGGPWITQYMILALLSIFLVSQSGEAVIFRFLILTFPARYIWRKAEIISAAR